MKNIINILLLSPVLIYMVLLLINTNLLVKKENISIFWIWDLEIPLISIISLFFIVYIFLMYFSWKFSTFFSNHRNKILEEENLKLKAQLSDLIPDINKNLDEKIKTLVDNFKDLTDKSLELHKKETIKVLWNFELEIKNLKENINK